MELRRKAALRNGEISVGVRGSGADNEPWAMATVVVHWEHHVSNFFHQ
jgi:hypothetical protein